MTSVQMKHIETRINIDFPKSPNLLLAKAMKMDAE